jgi:hypothetical protein
VFVVCVLVQLCIMDPSNYALAGRADIVLCVNTVRAFYGAVVGRNVAEELDASRRVDLPSDADFGRLRRTLCEATRPQVVLAFAQVDLATILAEEPCSSDIFVGRLRVMLAAGTSSDCRDSFVVYARLSFSCMGVMWRGA